MLAVSQQYGQESLTVADGQGEAPEGGQQEGGCEDIVEVEIFCLTRQVEQRGSHRGEQLQHSDAVLIERTIRDKHATHMLIHVEARDQPGKGKKKKT